MAKSKAEKADKKQMSGMPALKQRVSGWTDGLKAEFRKIIWPDRMSLVKQTSAVVAVSIVLGIMIAILDFIFQHGVDILVNISF